MGVGMGQPGDMLFGRRTWQDFIAAWGRRTDGNPFTTHMNAATKYVVSRTLPDADAWQNSILLRGDAVDTVAELKAQPGRELAIVGSASLVRSLHAAALIDRYTLLMCPLTLGSGARLFEGPAPLTEFELHRWRCDHQGRDHRAVHLPVSRGHTARPLSIHQPGGGVPDAEPMARITTDLHRLNEAPRESGSWVFTGGLHAPSSATVVRAGGMITNGPYPEGKEHIGGIWVLTAPDLDAALR
jgi:dihydrofolate reductase